MDLTEAKILAEMYIEQYAKGWRFAFDSAKRRFGCCNYSLGQISLSSSLVALNNMETVELTIKHEIAHAVVGYGHGHNNVWRRKLIEIGGDGKRCYSDNNVNIPEANYILTCPNCGKTVKRHRLTDRSKRMACSNCCNKYNHGKYTDKFCFNIMRNN